MGKLALATSHLDNLFNAWRAVRAQVQRSAWPQIAAELARFDAAPLEALRTIHRQLRQGEYRFSPKWGYTKRKSGGSRRGITVHGVSDRIVQRSILNVLSTRDPSLRDRLGSIPAMIGTPTSFAGTPGRGVPEAVALSVSAVRNGARAYVTSDIKDFFPKIPRGNVVEIVRENTNDEDFTNLFASALETEIRNQDDLLQWLGLFPLSEVGVAQGSLLSVLAGNLSLHRLDVELNRGGSTMVRYLDDFAIFGPDLDAVSAQFCRAQDELAKLGMTCYEPGDGSQKGFKGRTADGFDFLGCRIHPDGVSPGRAARRRLVAEVARAIRDAQGRIRGAVDGRSRRQAEPMYAQTLVRIDRMVRGWGDAYRFVTNRVAFAQLDAVIDRMLRDFRRWYFRYHSRVDPRVARRISGVALLGDTPPRPPRAESG
jgi:hypothetical protein